MLKLLFIIIATAEMIKCRKSMSINSFLGNINFQVSILSDIINCANKKYML